MSPIIHKYKLNKIFINFQLQTLNFCNNQILHRGNHHISLTPILFHKMLSWSNPKNEFPSHNSRFWTHLEKKKTSAKGPQFPSCPHMLLKWSISSSNTFIMELTYVIMQAATQENVGGLCAQMPVRSRVVWMLPIHSNAINVDYKAPWLHLTKVKVPHLSLSLWPRSLKPGDSWIWHWPFCPCMEIQSRP